MKRKYRHKGFTLLEILLTITLIGILAAIALIAINPNRQLTQSRDLNRQKDITDIQQAVELYAVRNSGAYPAGIESGVYKEICGEIIDINCVDLSILVPNYINSIPIDPNGDNYAIGINPDNNIVSIISNNAENREIGVNPFAVLLAGAKDPTFDTGIPMGFGDNLSTIVVQADGKMVLGGSFIDYLGVTTNRIIRLNADGSRDGSFNIGTGFNSAVRALAIQSDGKILVGGSFTTYQGVTANRIIRLNTDGSRDTSFNIGDGFDSGVSTLDIQADGKILVGGSFAIYNGLEFNKIIRLNSDGSIDNSFNIGTGFPGGCSLWFCPSVIGIDVQTDGKILVWGEFSTYNGVSANRIIRLNSDGSRDTSFNIGTGFNNTAVRTTSIQADGKIVVGGQFSTYNGVSANRIIRLNSDGSRDASFNMGTGFNNGVTTTSIQSDGKIVVGGEFTTYNGVSANRIIRLNSDGSRDNSFNGGTGFNSGVDALIIQSDGKIVVGGMFVSYNGVEANRIIRLNTDGSRDNSFDKAIPIGFDNRLNSIATQSDGKMVLGGSFIDYLGLSANRIIRLNTDGSRDADFNMGTGFNNSVDTIAIQADGKIITGGSFTTYNGVVANRIIRLNADGTRDISFNMGTGFNNSVRSITIQADGKILVGGSFATYNGASANYMIRLNTDGTRDNSFSIGAGFTSSDWTPYVNTLAIQTDGKIIVGGEFTTYQGVAANRIIRLNSNGSRDTSFDIGAGLLSVCGWWSCLGHNGIGVQTDGKILVWGNFTSYNGVSANRIIRLNSDGSRDASFNIGTGFNNSVRTLDIQSDGKILVGGWFESYNGVAVNRIIRLNSDGSRDTSFNIGTGFNNFVNTLATQLDGKILVGGSFRVYQDQPAGYLIRLGN